jgi:hypothetical protein
MVQPVDSGRSPSSLEVEPSPAPQFAIVSTSSQVVRERPSRQTRQRPSSGLSFTPAGASAASLRPVSGQRGVEIQKLLETIGGHLPAMERGSRLRDAVSKIKYLPAIDTDYPQPTDDQLAAFSKAADILENTVDLKQWPDVLTSLGEQVELACLGAEWPTFSGDLHQAAVHAKATWPEQDTTQIVRRLDELVEKSEASETTISALMNKARNAA